MSDTDTRPKWLVIIGTIVGIIASVATTLAVLQGNHLWPFPGPETPTPTVYVSPTPVVIPTPTATATPDPRSVVQALYRNVTANRTATVSYSFLSNSGGNSSWEQVPYSNKVCSFTPPPYHLQSFQSGGISFFCYGDSHASFSDFVYTVRETVVHGDGSILFFRAGTEFQDFFRFEVHIDGTYAYFVGSRTGGGSSAAIHRGRNVENILGAVAQGTQVALFVNGTLVDIVPDTVRSAGFVGVGADAYSENAYVTFTYAQVWDLS